MAVSRPTTKDCSKERTTKVKAIVIALLLLAAISCVGSGSYLAVRWSDNCQYTYTGKENFQTEQAYTDFKQAIVDANASILGTSALSSSPPIIVEYVITTEHNVDFPYGTKGDASNGSWVNGLMLAILGLVACLTLLMCVLEINRRETR
jgi:hypothetical protein